MGAFTSEFELSFMFLSNLINAMQSCRVRYLFQRRLICLRLRSGARGELAHISEKSDNWWGL